MKHAAENNWGGARPGAGAPEKDPVLKRKQIGVMLPQWLIDKLDAEVAGKPTNRTKEIERALLEKFGWNPPTVVKGN